MKIIIAGKHREFLNYIHQYKLSPTQARNISRIDQLRGLARETVVTFIGSWGEREDLQQIARMIRERDYKTFYDGGKY